MSPEYGATMGFFPVDEKTIERQCDPEYIEQVKELVADYDGVISMACGEGPHKPDVRRLLIAVFEDENRPLRFRASFHLMQTFGYGPAIDYVLTQLDSDDPDCQRQAFEWIGDAGNLGKPADEKLLLALGRLLQSPDHRVRRSAVHALSIYSGEEVVRRLIPLLNDPNNGIAGEVRIKLGHQKDKAMLRRLLVEAAAGGDDEDLRKKAAYALEQLGQEG